jgi:C-terminal processing protease CtpA/Prc
LTRAISKNGIVGLSEEFKGLLPDEIDRSNKAYREKLKQVFNMHPDSKRSFEKFVDVQLVWDETMAETAANYLKQKPGVRMLVLAGSGHIMYGYGIPDRLQRRAGLAVTTVIASSRYDLTEDSADYLVLSPEEYLEKAGLLGVFLNIDNHKLRIDGIADTSLAAKAGIKKGDQIVEVNGHVVHTLTELKLLLQNFKAGDAVAVTVVRKGQLKNLVFTVVLT